MRTNLRQITVTFFLAYLTFGTLSVQGLTISTDTTWEPGAYTYDNVLITNGATLTFNGAVTLNCTITLTIDPGSSISADGKGYGSGVGPGAGGPSGAIVPSGSFAGGAGYGGAGGNSLTWGSGGPTYGSAMMPLDMGSGGGGDRYPNGGSGGGVIRLTVSGVSTINGNLTANGTDGWAQYHYGWHGGGGGSGGSVYMSTGALSGSGVISAQGGGGGGGGGGGRIAIYCDTNTFTGTIDAGGGAGYEAGEDGTIAMNPGSIVNLAERSSSQSTSTETFISQQATLNNGQVSGDLTGTLSFTEFEMVGIATGSFAGKGFSKGQWSATLESLPYQGSWEGMFLLRPNERKIYLKGAVSGELSGTVEGFLSESTPESGIYDQYQAEWKIGKVKEEFISCTLNLTGTLSYQESAEYPGTEIYVLQTSVEGQAVGHYTGALSTVLTHLRIDSQSNPYYGEGFSIISYVSNIGQGEAWAYNNLISPDVSELKGISAGPLLGIISGTLNETVSPRTLILTVERIDLGLPPAPDLKVITWGPGRVSPGQTVNYIIEYRNDGLVSADETEIRFEFPEDIVYHSCSENGIYDWEIHGIVWQVKTVPARSTTYIHIVGYVPWGLSSGTPLMFSVSIYPFMGQSSPLGGMVSFANNILANEQEDECVEWRDSLKKGDILLVHYNGGLPPGHWDHAGIYDGSGYVIEAQRSGVGRWPIKTWDYPAKTDVAIYRVTNATQQQIDNAIEFANSQRGKPYKDWYNYFDKRSSPDNPAWYCSELVWAAYYNQGIDIEANPSISAIAPQEIAYDDNVEFISGHGKMDGGAYYPHCIPDWAKSDGHVSGFESEVQVARDPNRKLGPDGRVLPGDRLNYKVEYENEGEGIAFGVYFTDTLDEDLDDSTLQIGPVIDVDTGVQIASPGTYNPATRTITWFVGEVGPSQGGYADFSVNAEADSPDGTEIINFATVYFPSVPEATRTNGIVSIVSLNRPPVANAGPDQTVEQASYAGTESTLNGSGSTDEDSTPGTNDDIVFFEWYEGAVLLGSAQTLNHTFPLGSHTVTLVVTDTFGETDDDQVVVIVRDTTPPQFTLSVSPAIIWPPDHKMVLVTPTWTVSDICDESPTVKLVGITMNEGDKTLTYDAMFDDTLGDGRTANDIQVGQDGLIHLRAERSGTGTGRIYTLTWQAMDDSGNVARRSATVTVPRDQREQR